MRPSTLRALSFCVCASLSSYITSTGRASGRGRILRAATFSTSTRAGSAPTVGNAHAPVAVTATNAIPASTRCGIICSLVDRAPDITVVIAAHNEERRLGRCLESVQAAAAGRAVEVIVVDNCSTDGTAAVARAAGARVVAERALGAVNAKAAGVAAANAPLVAVIDADSVCPPDWLDKIARAFAGDAPLVGLSGPARYLGARRWVYAVMWLWYGFWKSVQALAGTAYYAVGT